MNLKKHISVILAVVMLLSVFPWYTVAESSETEKIEAIKTAWSSLEEKVLEVVPGLGQSGNLSAVYSLSSNTSNLPIHAAETLNEFVGSKYAKVTLTGSDVEADVFNAGTDYLKYGSSMEDILGCNVRFSFYMEELKSSFSFVPWFRRNYNGVSGSGNGTGKVYSVTENDVGKWVTLTQEDITSDTYSDVIMNLGNSLILRMTSEGENIVYFGSFLFTRNIELPENSENWGLAQWVRAAKALDLSDYYNADNFNKVLSDCETEDVKKTLDIQNAWLNMEKKITTLGSASASVTVHTGAVSFSRYNDTATENLPASAQTDIPKEYIGGDFNQATLTSQTNHLKSFVRYTNTGSGVDIKDSNVYVSLFVNGSLDEGETIKILPVYRENMDSKDYTTSAYTKEYTVTKENTGKWITLNADDITPNGKMAVSKISNSLLMSVVSPKEIEIIFGNVIFTQAATLPEDYLSWNFDDAINAAKALDLNQYVNTEAMIEAINNADPERQEIIERLKSAWGNLEEFVLEVTPMGNTAGHKGATDIVSGTYTAEANAPEIMGSKTITATFTSGTDVTPQSGPQSNYILYNATTQSIKGYNVYLNFKMEEVKGEFSFVPYFRRSGGATGVNTGKLYTVSSGDSGHWVSLSRNDITDETNYPNVPDLGNKIVLCVNSSETNTVTFGSFIFTKNVTLPEGCDDWDYDTWIQKAENLDISEFYNKSEFIEALEFAKGGIYGEEITDSYSVKYGDFSTELMQSFGYNLISHNSVYPALKVCGASTMGSSWKRELLYDGDPLTGYSVSTAQWNTGENDNMYCDLYFALDDIYLLNKVFVNHWRQEYLENGVYEIYVSKDIDDLFKAESLVFAYDNMSNSKNGTSYSQLISFADENKPIGRFVSLRIKCSFSDYEKAKEKYKGLLYVRLSEFGVYGERLSQKQNNYQNLLNEKSNVSLYTMNYKTKMFTSIGDYANKDYSYKMMKRFMVDSNDSSVYDIYAAKQGESSIDIVVDLGSELVIDRVMLKGGSTKEYWPQEMKIYTGASLNSVRTSNTPDCTFANRVEDGKYTYETAPKSVRYIRYQITNATHPDYAAHMLTVISELEIMGYAENKGEDLTGADYSDLNNDGKVNLVDFVKLKKRLVQNSNYWIIADLNKDSLVSAEDLALLKKYLLGIILKFS